MATNHPLLDIPIRKPLYRKAIFVVFSFAIIIATITLISTPPTRNGLYTSHSKAHICHQALDKTSCITIVSELGKSISKKVDDVDILTLVLQESWSRIQETLEVSKNINRRINDKKFQAALSDCLELMDLSMDRVMDSIAALANNTIQSHSNAHSWLSSILTNHETCIEGINVSGGSGRYMMEPMLNDLITRAKASLAMVVAIAPQQSITGLGDLITLIGGFPTWITNKDRKLLQSFAKDIKANLVVAKDGSGNYKTVQEAVAAATNKSKTRYVIYVKKGTYKENVEIGKDKKNIMLVGDGMDLTVITGSLNVIDGSTTFKSATVAAVGEGFIAQDIWFQNTAGPEKHQAVALRVGADLSAINRCRIDAYQDTLYTHSLRQFYRDCYITGTVDFIFGNAAVVFQNSKIVARKPMTGQKNMLTAQGRTDPNQNTGTSIQNCQVIASSDLQPVKGSIKTYLGRPWKEYSRTVFMQSNIGDHIDPAGWSEWSGDFALNTLYYGEYMNSGPGAGVSKRVKWPGYHVITNAVEAEKFTVAQLIQGGSWLKSTGVAFTEGL